MERILPKDAKLLPKDAKRVFEGIIYDVYHWQQQMFDGSYQTFEMLKRPDIVVVLAVKDDKIIVLRQEQPGDHGPFYDLPGGRHDEDGESELQAAKRELLEETGMTFKTWKLLDVTQPASKIEMFLYLFLATDFAKQVGQHLDVGEKIEVRELTLEAVKQLIDDPQTRYLAKNTIDKIDTIDELLRLPEYQGAKEI